MDVGGVVIPPYVGRPLRLAPFRGLRMDPRRVGDPASGRLYARPYGHVGDRLRDWQSQGRLSHDAVPAVYLHEYTAAGITVRGLVGALDLSHRVHQVDAVVGADGADDRAVLPHEGIHPVQADALADRMSALGLNVSPILLVHRAAPGLRALVDDVMATVGVDVFVDRVGQRHRLWAITEPERLAVVDDLLAGSTALIADGHHRYAGYLRMQQRAPGGAADRGLAMLIDQASTPLFLGPIHRTLEDVGLDDLAHAAETAGAHFELASRRVAVDALGPRTVVVSDGRRWASLRLPPAEDRAAVEMLHHDLLPALARGPGRIGYHHTVEDALGRAGHGTVAVLMPAPDVDLVARIAADRRLLPEKATSFQPKPSIGVLIRSLADEPG